MRLAAALLLTCGLDQCGNGSRNYDIYRDGKLETSLCATAAIVEGNCVSLVMDGQRIYSGCGNVAAVLHQPTEAQ